MHRSFSAPSTAALQRVFRSGPRHQRGNSDQCQRTYTRHASFPPDTAMPTRCRSDLCIRCAQPVSTRSRSMARVGVLLSEQDRAAQHAGHLRCQWRRSNRRCRRAAGAGLMRACLARRVKWCCQTEGSCCSPQRRAFDVPLKRGTRLIMADARNEERTDGAKVALIAFCSFTIARQVGSKQYFPYIIHWILCGKRCSCISRRHYCFRNWNLTK